MRWVLAALGVAALLGACGTRVDGGARVLGAPGAPSPPAGESASGPSGASGLARTYDQGVSPGEILVGASAPLSGLVAPLGGEALGAVDAYFEMVNARGGVGGRMLRLVALDDYLDPTVTLSNARRLSESDRVFALVLAFGDSTAEYVSRLQIPTMMFGLGPVPYASRYPTIYPLVGNALSWGHALIAGLRETGTFRPGMRVAVLYDTDELYTGPFVDLIVKAWELAGAKVVSRDAFNLGGQDCTQLVVKMRGLAIDWWDFQGLGAIPCLQASSRQGYRPAIGWGSWATSLGIVAQQVGAAIDGVWSESQGDTLSGAPRGAGAAHREYREAIERFHPELADPAHLESPVTMGYWIGAQLLVAAIDAQGATVTRAGVNDWIQGRQGYDTRMGMPIESFAPGCKTGSEAVWLARWHWQAGQLSRAPETGYLTSPFRDQFGGRCYLTLSSDSVLR